jgi:clumping factor A
MRKIILAATSALALSLPAYQATATGIDADGAAGATGSVEGGASVGAEVGPETGVETGADADMGAETEVDTDVDASTDMDTTDMGAGAGAEPDTGVQTGSALATDVEADVLIDMTVTSSDGVELGTIDDVVAGADGQPEMLVITSGGFLGFGGSETSVPAGEVEVDVAAETATVAMTETEFEAAYQ